jgi:catechol 2,3-dioxygenase-like lactoylglutathione lyase family enzyme
MSEFRIAPIFPVRDLDGAIEHYRRLGFTVRRYPPGGYGFVFRDGVEIHLGVVPDADRHPSAAYLFVEDADELARQWRAAGAEVHGPQDTEWGQHEAAVVDPDGNIIRFGAPMVAEADSAPDHR